MRVYVKKNVHIEKKKRIKPLILENAFLNGKC